jgi:ribonuclease J
MKKHALEKLRIVPLGGLGEVGKNMMSIEYGEDILIVDAGVMFPENDMWGVDLVIPDFNYLMDKKDRVRGIVLTHGHEDHIGALPYVLREIPVPVYGTRLTIGLAQVKLREEGLANAVPLHEVHEREPFEVGVFEIECFRVNHSVPDGVGLAIRTPRGLLIHSGDFKFDYSPVEGKEADLARLAQLGGEGVLLLMADSTNAEVPGFTPSEKVVEKAFDQVFSTAKGRIIVATFASLVSRVQQLVDCAAKHGRKIAFAGRSMIDNVKMAQDLGYLTVPDNLIVDLSAVKNLKPQHVVIAATGSQGEPTSALARMAAGTHKQVQIVSGDTVILSSHAIPGNEEMVSRTINKLLQRGAEVVYEKLAQVHVSGHASQEEQKLLLSLTKPKYFLPIHGELRHLHRHAALARDLGMPAENIFVVENGYAIEFDDNGAHVGERVPGGYVFVDGASVGDIGPAVLRDREALSRDGFVTAVAVVHRSDWSLARPVELITRGMVYLPDARELIDRAAVAAGEALKTENPAKDEADARERVRRALSRFLHDEIGRRPMVDVVVVAL